MGHYYDDVLVPLTKALTGFLDTGDFAIKYSGTSALSFSDVAPTLLSAIIGLFAPFLRGNCFPPRHYGAVPEQGKVGIRINFDFC
ncbi:hypothetical protein [Weissella cibaria]|uniref:hypothetical protein n=1 Tax=Weissella cibaria TaxID=137591 RepID=UPI001FD64668|nr:hypothetical protein [Weissella cibaria]